MATPAATTAATASTSAAATPAPAKTEDKKEDKKEGEVGSLSLDDVTGTLKLVSKDKKEFDVERKYSFVSTLVKTSLDTDPTATEVPIPGVSSAILAEVINYMNHHKGVEPPIVEKPLRSKVMKDVCKDPFDAEFIDRIGDNRQALYDLILAANYMDIKSLLHLGCAKVASLIKGQPLEKIKEILSVGTPAATATATATATADKKEEKKADTPAETPKKP
jgi:S-phase kinase-associated protein 1